MRRAAAVHAAPARTTPREFSVPPLRIAGVVLLAAGFIGIVLALRMDTSVATEFGLSRVNNVGLMNDRLAYLAASGFAGIVGAILVAATLKKP